MRLWALVCPSHSSATSVPNFLFVCLFLFRQFLSRAGGEGRAWFDSCDSRSQAELLSTYVRCEPRRRELGGQTARRFQNTHLLGGQAAAKPSTARLHLSDKQAVDLLKAESFCLYLLPFLSLSSPPLSSNWSSLERCRHPQKQRSTMRLAFVKLLQLKSVPCSALGFLRGFRVCPKG